MSNNSDPYLVERKIIINNQFKVRETHSLMIFFQKSSESQTIIKIEIWNE